VFALNNGLNCGNARLDGFVPRIRSHLVARTPKLCAWFDMRAAESRSASDWSSEDLALLPSNDVALVRRRIEGNTSMDDPRALWRSHNWITVPKIRRVAAKDAALTLRFHGAMAVSMLERGPKDKEIASRRAECMVAGIRTALDVRLTTKS
jgi:hypothetical protein